MVDGATEYLIFRNTGIFLMNVMVSKRNGKNLINRRTVCCYGLQPANRNPIPWVPIYMRIVYYILQDFG